MCKTFFNLSANPHMEYTEAVVQRCSVKPLVAASEYILKVVKETFQLEIKT